MSRLSSFIVIALIAYFFLPISLPRLFPHELMEGEKAARDFSFNEVSIGTPVIFFRHQFPNAELVEHPAYPGRKTSVVRPTPRREITVEFYRDRVFHLKTSIAIEELQRTGGVPAFKDALVKKFGPPHKTQPNGNSGWTYPESGLSVLFTTTDGSATLSVTDMKTYLKIAAAKAITKKLQREASERNR